MCDSLQPWKIGLHGGRVRGRAPRPLRYLTELEWPIPGNVDLVKSAKTKRKPDNPGELGIFYLRY